MKKTSKLICAIISTAIAFMGIMTFLFPIISYPSYGMGIKSSFMAFELIGEEYHDAFGYDVLPVVIFIFSICFSITNLVFLILNVVRTATKKYKLRLQVATVTLSLISSFAYLILGAVHKNSLGIRYLSTSSYVPFILITLLFGALITFWCLGKYLKDNSISVADTRVAKEPKIIASKPQTATSVDKSTMIQEQAEALLTYKKLLDEGAITEDEYKAKKKQILDL